MADLYLIENVACDGETYGLAHIPEDAIELFKNIIKNLNRNATWSENPGINVYKIDTSFIRMATNEDYNADILYDETGQKYVIDKPIRVRDRFDNLKLNEGVELIC